MAGFLKKFPTFAGCLLLVFCFSPILHSSASITLETHLGFDDHFRLNSWTPVTILVENRGRSISGTLEVVLTSGSEYYRNLYDTRYTRDITLPSNSRKQFAFTVRIDTFSRPLTIRFRQSERIITSETIDLRHRYTNFPMVIGAGRNLSPTVLSDFPESVVPFTVRPQYLPETYVGYEGVALLILDAGMLEKLNERQFDAVVQWVGTGGELVIAGGLNIGFYSHSRLHQLLPLTVHGLERMTRIQSMLEFCGKPLSGSEPFLILNASVRGGDIIVAENGIPLITQKPMGAGQLLFFSFDFRAAPFSDWPGRLQFWDKILAMGTSRVRVEEHVSDAEIVGAVTQAVDFDFPGILVVLVCIVAYIIVCRLVLKNFETDNSAFKKQLALLGSVLPVFIAGFYLLFHLMHKDAGMGYNAFMHMRLTDNRMISQCRYTIGLYSLRNMDLTFSLDYPFHPIVPLTVKNTDDTVNEWLELHENTEGQRVRTHLNAWSKKHFTMQTWMNFPFSGRVFKEGDDLILEINNSSSHRVIDCKLYFSGSLFSIGDIEADMHFRKRINDKLINDSQAFKYPYLQLEARRFPPSFPEALYKSVNLNFGGELVASLLDHYLANPGKAVFFGWVGSELITMSQTGKPVTGSSLTFLELELSIT